MEIYAARLGIHDFDLPISPLFWGAVIFVAVVAAWILAGRAIARLRNRGLDGGAVEGGHRRAPSSTKHWQKYGTRKIGLSTAPVSSVRRWDAGRRA